MTKGSKKKLNLTFQKLSETQAEQIQRKPCPDF